MSAAKHILLPHQYASAEDLPREESARKQLLDRFHHMTTEERDALLRQRRIRRIAPKLYRAIGVACGTRPASDCGKGLISREIEPPLRASLAALMWRPAAPPEFPDPEAEGMGGPILQSLPLADRAAPERV